MVWSRAVSAGWKRRTASQGLPLKGKKAFAALPLGLRGGGGADGPNEAAGESDLRLRWEDEGQLLLQDTSVGPGNHKAMRLNRDLRKA